MEELRKLFELGLAYIKIPSKGGMFSPLPEMYSTDINNCRADLYDSRINVVVYGSQNYINYFGNLLAKDRERQQQQQDRLTDALVNVLSDEDIEKRLNELYA